MMEEEAAANEGSFPIRSFKKWKAARMKGDKYINEDVVAVASKIDSLERRVAKAHSRRVHGGTFCRRRLGSRITLMLFEGRRGEYTVSSTCNPCLP
ncbi:hypothetical protein K1719_042585 [Acacia pycnantha]|nr:hypothetical protein K1719_042585 [Acacia pycnantha]